MTVEHAREELRAQGLWGFYKLAASAIGQDDELVYPAHTTQLDYEGEVAIVFSRNAKNEAAGNLDDTIWGYTLQNDWSLRDQSENPLSGLAFAKNFDGSSSLGPCIVVDEIDDPTNVPFETRVNGELRQQGTTADMVWSFGEAFEYLSRRFTLQPGDVLSAGTNAGTAIDLPPAANGELDVSRFAGPGDVVEISSPLIGTLRNTSSQREPVPGAVRRMKRMAAIGRLTDEMQHAGVAVAILSRAEDVCYATGFELPPPIDARAAFAYAPPLALVCVDGTRALVVPDAYAASQTQRRRDRRCSCPSSVSSSL